MSRSNVRLALQAAALAVVLPLAVALPMRLASEEARKNLPTERVIVVPHGQSGTLHGVTWRLESTRWMPHESAAAISLSPPPGAVEVMAVLHAKGFRRASLDKGSFLFQFRDDEGRRWQAAGGRPTEAGAVRVWGNVPERYANSADDSLSVVITWESFTTTPDPRTTRLRLSAQSDP